MTWVLTLATVVLLALVGCAGMEWFIDGYKSTPLALAGFAGACWCLRSLGAPPSRKSP